MFHVSQRSHHSWLHHIWADVAFFTAFIENSSSMPQQECTSPSLHVCVRFAEPTLCFSVSSVLHYRPLLVISFYYCRSVSVWSSEAAITGPSPPDVPMLSPHWPRLLATTGPLSGLPAQVARRLYVAQSTPRHHTSASGSGEAGWKVAFQSHFVILVYGQRRQQVVT